MSQIILGPQLEERVRVSPQSVDVVAGARCPTLSSSSDAEGGSASTLIGQTAPEFRLTSLTGEAVQPHAYRGQVLILDFWASWCGPCMQSLPLVSEIVASFQAGAVELVAINIQESESRAEAAAGRLGLSGPVAVDADGRVAASYLATNIPYTVVIDRQGTVRYVLSGGEPRQLAQLRPIIERLLRDEVGREP